jgi:hypothetical protein
MRCGAFLMLPLAATAFHAPFGMLPAARRASLVSLKEAGDAVAVQFDFAAGSIVEFDDGKHKDRALLGIIISAAAKAKGGARYSITDANQKTYTVAGRSIHFVAPASKGKETDPAEILKDFIEVAAKDPVELVPSLGLDVTELELAWEVCAQDASNEFTTKSILGLVDDKIIKTPVDKYKAFRLLTSDLGRVFFKTLSADKYRAKAATAVAASKLNWCNAFAEAQQEWCFV